MKIGLLADHELVLPVLTAWYEAEWEPYYGVYGPGDAREDLVARCNREALPIGLVAMESAMVMGTAALDLDAATGLTPSVVGLLVGEGFRRRGVAMELLLATETLARDLGCRELFISTSVLGGLLERLGWRNMGETRFLNDATGDVYLREI